MMMLIVNDFTLGCEGERGALFSKASSMCTVFLECYLTPDAHFIRSLCEHNRPNCRGLPWTGLSWVYLIVSMGPPGKPTRTLFFMCQSIFDIYVFTKRNQKPDVICAAVQSHPPSLSHLSILSSCSRLILNTGV